MKVEEFGQYMLDNQCGNGDDKFTFELHCMTVEIKYNRTTGNITILNEEST